MRKRMQAHENGLESPPGQCKSLRTRMFWTFDIFFSCSTGVVRADGSVEYDMKTILKRYAKTWLAMDLLIAAWQRKGEDRA